VSRKIHLRWRQRIAGEGNRPHNFLTRWNLGENSSNPIERSINSKDEWLVEVRVSQCDAVGQVMLQGVTVRPLSPPPPLMTLATRRPPGRRRSESPVFAPVPSCSRDLPAAAPVAEARQNRCSGSALTTRQAARRLAPGSNQESAARLQGPVRRSTRRRDLTKATCGSRRPAKEKERDT